MKWAPWDGCRAFATAQYNSVQGAVVCCGSPAVAVILFVCCCLFIGTIWINWTTSLKRLKLDNLPKDECCSLVLENITSTFFNVVNQLQSIFQISDEFDSRLVWQFYTVFVRKMQTHTHTIHVGHVVFETQGIEMDKRSGEKERPTNILTFPLKTQKWSSKQVNGR